MEHCPFCAKEISRSVFAKSENFYAIYNIAPVFPGHSLIIPKEHATSILDFSESRLTEMTLFAGNVTRLLLRVFKTEGFNWSVQDNETAGQTIAHVHFHIVPRKEGDLSVPGDWYPMIQDNAGEILDSIFRDKLDSGQMDKIVAHLRKESRKDGLFY
jgi:bis(5'-adenosyl)-triphosphatase